MADEFDQNVDAVADALKSLYHGLKPAASEAERFLGNSAISLMDADDDRRITKDEYVNGMSQISDELTRAAKEIYPRGNERLSYDQVRDRVNVIRERDPLITDQDWHDLNEGARELLRAGTKAVIVGGNVTSRVIKRFNDGQQVEQDPIAARDLPLEREGGFRKGPRTNYDDRGAWENTDVSQIQNGSPQKRFQLADKDKNGKLSQAELNTWFSSPPFDELIRMPRERQDYMNELVKRRFNNADADHSGHISEPEMRKYFGADKDQLPVFKSDKPAEQKKKPVLKKTGELSPEIMDEATKAVQDLNSGEVKQPASVANIKAVNPKTLEKLNSGQMAEIA